MITHWCLNKEELKQLVDFKADGLSVEDERLQILIENAENWQDELGCLTYLFAMVLEGKNGAHCQRLIDLLYQLAEDMYFDIQEFDFDFVAFMLRNVRSAGLSLEEELIDLQNCLREFRYEHTLRY